MLEEGKFYQLPNGDVIECLEVNWSWALVRPKRKVHREFETSTGAVVAFDAPAGVYTISSKSVLKEVVQ